MKCVKTFWTYSAYLRIRLRDHKLRIFIATMLYANKTNEFNINMGMNASSRVMSCNKVKRFILSISSIDRKGLMMMFILKLVCFV